MTPAGGRPELSFVVVSWNGGEPLRRAIGSIVDFPPALAHDIVVVDNASTDGSLAWLRSGELAARLRGVPLRVIANAENLGFARANNQAFAATEAPLLFLLNADAELRPGTADALLSTLAEDEAIGACGPRIVNPDGSLQLSVWRNPPRAWATLLAGLKLAWLLPRRLRGELLLGEHWAHDRRRDVPVLGGAAILARRRTIAEVGGFDEGFDMYGEDFEWAVRIRRAGWRMVFDPAATVVHQGAHSSLRRWSAREKLAVQYEAHFRLLRLSMSRRAAVANLAATCLVLAVRRAWRLLRGRPEEEVGLALRMFAAELWRTLRSRPPQKPRYRKVES